MKEIKTKWDELKEMGEQHYKTGGIEPVDLYASGDMFQDFALCSIIKYAFRSRRNLNQSNEMMIKNLDKIIDYAEKLKATINKPKENLFKKYKK